MEDVVTEEIGTQENTDVTQMTDEQLAELSSKYDGETDESAVEEEPEPEDVEGGAEGEQETNEKATESDGEETVEQLKEKLKSLEGENEKLKKHSDTQAKYENYRSNEIGALRKQLEFLRGQVGMTDEQLQDLALIDPARAKSAIAMENQRQQEIRNVEAQIASNDVRESVASLHPDIDNIMPDIVNLVAQEDPVSAEMFKSNPYAFGPAILHNLAERAKQSKEIEKLNIQLEIAKREKKNAVDETLKKVDGAAKAKTSARQPATSPKGKQKNYDRATLASMSDAELNALWNDVSVAE